MKHSITGLFLAILTAIPVLVACGVAAPSAATVAPTVPSATTIPITTPATSVPIAATSTRPSTGRPATPPVIDRPGTPRASATATQTAQGPRYSLSLGEAVTIPNSGLTILFKDVTNDSRCADSQFIACAWAGEATVNFEATVGSESHSIVLIIPGLTKDTTVRPNDPKTQKIYKGYVIQIVSLEPQPSFTPPPVGRGTATIPLAPTHAPSEAIATILVTTAP